MDFQQIIKGFISTPVCGQTRGEFGFVYMFYEKAKEQPVYVGSTKNPENRLRQHFPKTHSIGGGALTAEAHNSVNRIRVAYVGNSYDCRAIEGYFIRKYRPIYNTVVPYERETREPSNLIFASFTKQEFMEDSTIVWRCFTEIIKRYQNKAYALEQECSIYRSCNRRKP